VYTFLIVRLGFDAEDFHSVTGNATLRWVAEACSQGQLSLSTPVFLSPANAAIISIIGTPIYLVTSAAWESILKNNRRDFEEHSEDAFFHVWDLRVAARCSLIFGLTVAAMVLRLRELSVSIWYSALCGWAGVHVLIVPLVLFDIIHSRLAHRPLRERAYKLWMQREI
jgi:uncharacterized membrane protein